MSIINPKINSNIVPAYIQETAEDQKILFVGQKTSGGSATAGTLYASLSNEKQEDVLFGENSMLATMVRAAKKLNKVTRMDAIPLDDDGGATAATGNVTFTGAATATGTVHVTIGSYANNRYKIEIASAEAATAIGAKLEALITADSTSLVTAVNTAGDVALTAVNKGIEGDQISIKLDGSVAGVTLAVTKMAGGATNPTLTGVFDVVGNLRYQTIVWPSLYEKTELKSFLDDRFNSDVRILDGIGIWSITSDLADIKISAAQNSQNLGVHGNRFVNKTLHKGSALLEMDYAIAAQFGAIRALRMTDGAQISDFVDGGEGVLDTQGGIALASLPYFNTPFSNLPVIEHDNQWLDSEREELNEAGVFVLGNNIANNEIIADRVVTTYLTNSIGDPDVTFKYMNYVDTASVVRWYFHENLRQRFRQTRLTTGDIKSGRNQANAHIIQGAVMDYYKDLADLALLVAGEDARKYFLDNLTITINETESKAVIFMITQIVTQLEIIDITMQIGFSTTD